MKTHPLSNAVSAAAAAAHFRQGAANVADIVPVVSYAVVAATVCAVVSLLQCGEENNFSDFCRELFRINE